MKRKNERRAIVMSIFLVLSLACMAHADSIVFDSNGTIEAPQVWQNVTIQDTPPDHTIVDMSGGTVDSIGLFDQSTLNISGGDVSTISAYEWSSVNASGGSIFSLNAWNTSSVNISVNALIENIRTYESGIFYIDGGVVDDVSIYESGILHLSGGNVSDYLGAGDSGVINVYGWNLAKFDSGGNYGYGYISGEWEDYTPFSIDLYSSGTYSRITLHEIPEPSSILLIIIGSIIFRKKRK